MSGRPESIFDNRYESRSGGQGGFRGPVPDTQTYTSPHPLRIIRSGIEGLEITEQDPTTPQKVDEDAPPAATEAPTT